VSSPSVDPVSSSLDAAIAKAKAREARIPERVYRCACQDTGLIITATDTYRPCERCNQPAWRRWQNGCYRQDHPGCSTCRPRKTRTGEESYGEN
jgi:hypothetical protein